MSRFIPLWFALLAISASWPSPASIFGRIDFTAEGDFSESALQRGVKATQGQCEKVENAVWVSTKDYGEECIKYWAAGFNGTPVERAVIFFHGDVWVGAGKTGKYYLEANNEKLQQEADAWGTRLGVPYVFVARPGTYGSSGDHMQRRRLVESVLLSAALDKIKERMNIKELVVAGQSGGGHVTSSLLTLRSDIVCAIPTSGPSSPRVRQTLRGIVRDQTGYTDHYEPTEHLQKDKMNENLMVFVLGDPNDANVVWPSQTIMATKLQEIGVNVETLTGEGTGPEHHSLSNSARRVAGWCANGLPKEEIIRNAAKGLKG